MKSRQISLALFIKFDNRYRPPEGQKHSAACRLEGGREYGGDPLKTAVQLFSQSDVMRPCVHNHLHLCDVTLIPLSPTENTLLKGLIFGSLVSFMLYFSAPLYIPQGCYSWTLSARSSIAGSDLNPVQADLFF